MANLDLYERSDDVQIGDLFAPLLRYSHLIWHGTIAATAIAVLAAGIYFIRQPTHWSTSLEFRPVFSGAPKTYPNTLPFASTDIVDATVLDQVYDKNQLAGSCPREDFRSGFVVEEYSPEMLFLDMDYQGRLADTRLSAVDRERLQTEYRAKRQGLPTQYRLTWMRADACAAVPAAVASKALTEVLGTWASDAEAKRGVLKLRIAVLTPSVLDLGKMQEQPLLIRGELIRTAINRVIANVHGVEQIPGAELARLGNDHASLLEVRARLEDLIQLHLDPLLAAAGRGLGTDAIRWVEESLAVALTQQRGAEERFNAYQTALREYSGVPAAQATNAQRPQGSSDVPTLSMSLDRTFIDRVVELSNTNVTFRQDLTRSMVLYKISAVDTATNVAHYQRLLDVLKRGTSSSLTPAEVEQRLNVVIGEAVERIRQFNALYDEFSKVSLRSGPMLYRIERPPQVQTVRSFSLRSLVLVVAAVLVITPIFLAVGCLAHHALRQLMARARPA